MSQPILKKDRVRRWGVKHSLKFIFRAGAIKFKVRTVYVCHSKQNIYICIRQASPLGGRVKTYWIMLLLSLWVAHPIDTGH